MWVWKFLINIRVSLTSVYIKPTKILNTCLRITAQFSLQCARGRAFKAKYKHPHSHSAAHTQPRPWPCTSGETGTRFSPPLLCPWERTGRIQWFTTSVSLLQLRQGQLTGRLSYEGLHTTLLVLSSSPP